jgi:ABC-2 type transport system permease protein
MNKIGKVSLRYYSDLVNDKEFGLDGKESFSLALPVEGKKEFIDTFKEELSNLSLDELKNSEPLATVLFEYSTYDVSSYYVYPSFTKTLALLKKYRFDHSQKIELADIRRITVSDYHPKYEQIIQDGLMSTSVAQDNYKEATYSKLEQITEILPNLISRDYYYNNNALLEAEEYTDVILYAFNEDYNNELSYSYMFRKGTIPNFIKKDLNIPE